MSFLSYLILSAVTASLIRFLNYESKYQKQYYEPDLILLTNELESNMQSGQYCKKKKT